MKKVKEAGYSRARISPDSPEYKFADRLKEEMHKKGMTQEYLARQMDVSLDTIKNWCQHYTFPKELQMGRLCEIFKPCSVDYFHGTIDAPNWDIQGVADFLDLSPAAVTSILNMEESSVLMLSELLEEVINGENHFGHLLYLFAYYYGVTIQGIKRCKVFDENNLHSMTEKHQDWTIGFKKEIITDISQAMDKLLNEFENRIKKDLSSYIPPESKPEDYESVPF